MAAVPAVIFPAPDEFRAMQPVGSSTQSDGMATPGLLPVRMTADAVVVSPNWFTTPPKRLLRVIETVTLKRWQGEPSAAPALATNVAFWMSVSETGKRHVTL